MNVYDAQELDRIKKASESNERLEDWLKQQRGDCEIAIAPFLEAMSIKMDTRDAVSKISDTQAMALVHRQSLSEKIAFFLNKRSKETVKLKKLKQDKFIFYATGFGVKTNASEKTMLIDAHLAENERTLELIEAHVEFLRDNVRVLEGVGYGVKNIVDFANHLSKMPL
jgi:hypothetical protein